MKTKLHRILVMTGVSVVLLLLAFAALETNTTIGSIMAMFLVALALTHTGFWPPLDD